MDPKTARELGRRLGMAKSAKGTAWWQGQGRAPVSKPGEYMSGMSLMPGQTTWGDPKTPFLQTSHTGIMRTPQGPSYKTEGSPGEMQGMYRFRGWNEGEPWISPVTREQYRASGGNPALGYFTAFKPAQEFKQALPRSVWGAGAPSNVGATPGATGVPVPTIPMGESPGTAGTPAVKPATPGAADAQRAAAEARAQAEGTKPAPAQTQVQPQETAQVQPQKTQTQPATVGEGITPEQHAWLTSKGGYSFAAPQAAAAKPAWLTPEFEAGLKAKGYTRAAAPGAGGARARIAGAAMTPEQAAAERAKAFGYMGFGGPSPEAQYAAWADAMNQGYGRAWKARATRRFLQNMLAG